MSLVLNAKNDVVKIAPDLLNFRERYPEIHSNQDIAVLVIRILETKLNKDKASKVVQNSWNTINKFVKTQMEAFATSLVQDLMLREELDAHALTVEDPEAEGNDWKLDCGLTIRINDKHVLFSVWVQLQRLRDLLLLILKS